MELSGVERGGKQLVHLLYPLVHQRLKVAAIAVVDVKAADDRAVWSVAGDEVGARRTTGVEPAKLDLGDEDVRRSIGFEDVSPPRAARTIDLRGVDQQRVGAKTRRADVVDRAGRRLERRPGTLPGIARLDAGQGASGKHHRDQQHWFGSAQVSCHANQFGRAGSVEQHAEVGDVTAGADLLLFNRNRADEAVERRVVDLDVSHVGVRGPGDLESSAVQALVENDHSGAVEEQDFERIFSATEEDEERATPRVVPDLLRRQARKVVERQPLMRCTA